MIHILTARLTTRRVPNSLCSNQTQFPLLGLTNLSVSQSSNNALNDTVSSTYHIFLCAFKFKISPWSCKLHQPKTTTVWTHLHVIHCPWPTTIVLLTRGKIVFVSKCSIGNFSIHHYLKKNVGKNNLNNIKYFNI